tara:strand:+ start:5910 stop:6614 length:705 start_codon:yes stop_codon:yes gene_type:complete
MASLALLPFFQFFRGTPHQLAAISELERSLPEGILDEDAAWFDAWRASGIDQELHLPRYYRQRDLRDGARMCFTSAAAMVARFYRKVESQQEYNRIRAEHGDTTSVMAQVKTLTSLGLRVRYVQDADASDIEDEIDQGRPVLVGWLHAGDLLRGEPPMCSSQTCGHWSVIHGYSGRYSNDSEWLMSDPMGVPDMAHGGHNHALSGYRVRVRQAEFHQRWQVDGPRSGWAIFVDL